MHSEGQLQDTKNNLSPFIKQATAGDPHVVTVHGKPTAGVVSTA